MKRWMSLLLGGALLLGLAACGAVSLQSAPQKNQYALYYCERDLETAQGSDAVRIEYAALDGSEELETAQLAEALMSRLLQGPEDETLKSPFPSGTQLLSCSLGGSRAQVDLSAAYGMLSGVELTLADYCITLTLTQIPGISSVYVTVRGQPLAYRERQVFTSSDVLLTSSEDVVASVNATLYFLNDDGELTGESRTVDLYEGDTQVKALLMALQNGPQDRNLRSALPESFRVQFIWQEEEECYVNLSADAETELPHGQEMRSALTALAQSLCSLDSIDRVYYLVDGESKDVYCGVLLESVYAAD